MKKLLAVTVVLGLVLAVTLARPAVAQTTIECHTFNDSRAEDVGPEYGVVCAGDTGTCQDCVSYDSQGTGNSCTRDVGSGEGDTFARDWIVENAIAELMCFLFL